MNSASATSRHAPRSLARAGDGPISTIPAAAEPRGPSGSLIDPEASPWRKAAILVVSLEEPLAAQLLAQLNRTAVEAVTLEMARLERMAPDEQQAVLEEFYRLGICRLRFAFDDLVRLSDAE